MNTAVFGPVHERVSSRHIAGVVGRYSPLPVSVSNTAGVRACHWTAKIQYNPGSDGLNGIGSDKWGNWKQRSIITPSRL